MATELDLSGILKAHSRFIAEAIPYAIDRSLKRPRIKTRLSVKNPIMYSFIFSDSCFLDQANLVNLRQVNYNLGL